MDDVRVTRVQAQALYGSTGESRVTRAQAQAQYNDRTFPVRVTRAQGQAVYGDRTYPVHVSTLLCQALMSVGVKPRPPQPLPDLPNPSPLVPGDGSNTPIGNLQREYNPFRPSLPNEVEAVDPVLYDFLREHVEIQRDQHNVTQAGDSTFPWELLTKVGPERQFTLGSMGRFYHDDFGIILARYCQFTGMVEADWITGPVGYLNSSNVVDYRVTNDFAKSSGANVAGVLGAFQLPSEGWYGWVLTQGGTHAQLRVPLEIVPQITANSQLVWTGISTVGISGEGKVLGKVVGAAERVNATEGRLPAGTVMLGNESPSVDSLRAMMGGDFESIQTQLAATQKSINDANFGTLIPNVKRLVQAVADHESRISQLEQSGTQQSLTSILSRLDTLEAAGAGDALYERIMGQVNPQIIGLSGRIDELAQQISGQNYDFRIQQLQSQIDRLKANTKQLVPLTTGEIPANFVQMPNGELVFVEVS